MLVFRGVGQFFLLVWHFLMRPRWQKPKTKRILFFLSSMAIAKTHQNTAKIAPEYAIPPYLCMYMYNYVYIYVYCIFIYYMQTLYQKWHQLHSSS